MALTLTEQEELVRKLAEDVSQFHNSTITDLMNVAIAQHETIKDLSHRINILTTRLNEGG